MAYLEIRNLTKKYGEKEGIEDLSFSLEKGKILSVLGASGSGKTTLLRCLVGLAKPDQGTMMLEGKILSGGSENLDKGPRIGLVFQNFHLFPHLSVLENVALAPSLVDQKKAILRKKKWHRDETSFIEAQRLLNLVGMASKMKNYPNELSGGQQQRVAIARALAMSPDILAFDEPTSALDPALRDEVTRLFLDLRSSGKTLIVVTHDLDFAKGVSDEVLFLKEGTIQALGPADKLFQPGSLPLAQKILGE